MRASLRISSRLAALAAAFLAGASAPASAQLPNASAAAFGMGGNFTAIARGYEAVAWNPANLAMPGRPFFSIGLGIAGGSAGMDPVDVKALTAFSGVVIDSATRVAWIDKARLSGSQRVKLDGGVTPLAFSLGPIGVQYGASIYTNADLSPDAFEAALFGNAGRTGGQAKALDFTGTNVRVGALSAAGLSFALPIPINLTNGLLANEHAAIGITGKYVMGHALVIAQDEGSSLPAGSTDILLRFPIVAPDTNYNGNLGNGAAADVAIAWSGGPWRVGVLAENVFSAFKWDTTVMAFFPGTGSFVAGTGGGGSSGTTDFDQQPYNAAPQELRDIVAAQRFKPAIAIGAAYKPMSSLTLTADMKKYTGGDEAIVFGPKSRFGVGAEWRVLPFIPLRAGIASISDGWQAGAGVGVHVLGYELGVSTSIVRRGQATGSGLMIGLVGIGR
jgi:hypothetical protein